MKMTGYETIEFEELFEKVEEVLIQISKGKRSVLGPKDSFLPYWV